MENIGLFLSFEEAEADVRNVACALGWDVVITHCNDAYHCRGTFYSFTLWKVVMFSNTSKYLKHSFELIPGAINPNWKLLLKKALIDQEVEACGVPRRTDPYSKVVLNMDIAHMRPGIDIVDMGPVSVAVERPTYREKAEEKSVKNDAFGKCQSCIHGKEPIDAPMCDHCFFVSPHPNYTPDYKPESEKNCWNCVHHNTISDNCRRCYPGQYDGFEPKEVTNEN